MGRSASRSRSRGAGSGGVKRRLPFLRVGCGMKRLYRTRVLAAKLVLRNGSAWL